MRDRPEYPLAGHDLDHLQGTRGWMAVLREIDERINGPGGILQRFRCCHPNELPALQHELRLWEEFRALPETIKAKLAERR